MVSFVLALKNLIVNLIRVGLPTLLFLYEIMSKEELIDKIRLLIEPVINSLGVELDYIEFDRMKSRALMRIYIDHEAGIKIEDCERVSREVSAILDVEDLIPNAYVLEVSSPGLDRPLRKPGDFKRFTGSTIRAITVEPVEKETFFIGKLIEADDNEIQLLLPKERRVTIPYKNISKARLEVDI